MLWASGGLIPQGASPRRARPQKRASPAPSGDTRLAPRSGPGGQDQGTHAQTRAGPAATLRGEPRARAGAGGVEKKEVIMNKSAAPC